MIFKYYLKGFTYCVIIASIISCQGEKKAQDLTTAPDIAEWTNEVNLSFGFQSLSTNCFSCHNADAQSAKGVAPTMAEIKQQYLKLYPEENDFTDAIQDFLNNPTSEQTIIAGAVETYGMMPKMNFETKQIADIAAYIYRTSLEDDNWYAGNFESETKKHFAADKLPTLSDEALGLKYAMSTKGILGKNLMGAVKKNGAEFAVEFCNERAIVLTDSMSVALNMSIKRVSDHPRNQNNAANEMEAQYIFLGKENLKKGKKIKPRMQEVDGKMVGYYPIVTNAMCLKCHGAPNTQIATNTLTKINSLYPNDQAIGYTENQLRGIWVVTMEKRD